MSYPWDAIPIADNCLALEFMTADELAQFFDASLEWEEWAQVATLRTNHTGHGRGMAPDDLLQNLHFAWGYLLGMSTLANETMIQVWRRGQPKLWACEECGCTDIQMTAWVDMNGERIRAKGDDGPRTNMWCPQCEEQTGEGEVKYASRSATFEQPWAKQE